MFSRNRLKIGNISVASFVRNCVGERVSGDTVIMTQQEEHLFLAIVDALGHGPQANSVAQQAEQFLKDHWKADVLQTMLGLHKALSGTIGAAAGLCVVDTLKREVHYAGVGNTVFRIVGSREARLISVDGIVGIHMHEPNVQNLKLNVSDVVLLYTDGVSDRFTVEQYPQIIYHSPAAVAHRVVERFGKTHDDATCMVMRFDR